CCRRSSRAASFSPLTAAASLASTPSSDLALSRPAAAASLNDWSPRPPMSYARPTLTALFVLELVLLLELLSSLLPHAARARAATEVTAAIFITRSKGVSFFRCLVEMPQEAGWQPIPRVLAGLEFGWTLPAL